MGRRGTVSVPCTFAVYRCQLSVFRKKREIQLALAVFRLSVIRAAFSAGKDKESPMRGHTAVSFLTLRAGGGADVLSCNLIVPYG